MAGSGRRYSASICSRLDRERPFILRLLKAESDSKMATFKDSRELNTSSSTSAYTAGKAVSRHFQPTPCPWDGVPVRVYGTSIMLGKCRKLLVDYRTVVVAAGYCCFEVVRYDCHRNTAVKMKCVFTCLDQILF